MNADVTMPLSELDALRTKLEQEEYKVSVLETSQKMIKVEVRERVAAYKESYDVRLGMNRIDPRKDWSIYPHTYINLEDVIGPIRSEESRKVQDQLNERDRQITDYRKKLSEKDEAIKTLKTEYEHKLKLVTNMQKENTKDNIIGSLQKQVNDLNTQLSKIAKQNFWDRLFHPIPIKQ